MVVPLLDLKRQYATLREEIRGRIDEVLESQQFILGPCVEAFERALAERIGVTHAVGVASGTDALLLSLLALGLEPGDEAITAPFTYFATAGAIHQARGQPVFVDIEADTFNLDPERVEAAITPRTRVIVPVHLFGQMADMEPLRDIAERHGLALLEDAAQAIGARQRLNSAWRSAGQVGDMAALSFFPSKNLGGYGDGGMIVTDDARRAERVLRLRTHGGPRAGRRDEVGKNSRLDALQAAVLSVKLAHLDGWNAARRAHARWYDRRLEPLEAAGYLRRPVERAHNEATYHQYTLRARDRDRLRAHLEVRGIGCAIYYQRPLHLEPAFRYLGYRGGDFPESERAAAEAISVPIYPELTEAEREEVAAAIEEFYR